MGLFYTLPQGHPLTRPGSAESKALDEWRSLYSSNKFLRSITSFALPNGLIPGFLQMFLLTAGGGILLLAANQDTNKNAAVYTGSLILGFTFSALWIAKIAIQTKGFKNWLKRRPVILKDKHINILNSIIKQHKCLSYSSTCTEFFGVGAAVTLLYMTSFDATNKTILIPAIMVTTFALVTFFADLVLSAKMIDRAGSTNRGPTAAIADSSSASDNSSIPLLLTSP